MTTAPDSRRFAAAVELVSGGGAAKGDKVAAGRKKPALRSLSDAQRLRLYALFKQANQGPVQKSGVSRPGMLDFVGRAKWDAWAALGVMSPAEATLEYIRFVENWASKDMLDEFERNASAKDSNISAIDRGDGKAQKKSDGGDSGDGGDDDEDDDFDDDDDDDRGSSSGLGLGLAVSRIVLDGNDDDRSVSDGRNSIFDWCKAGNIEKVQNLLLEEKNRQGDENRGFEVNGLSDEGLALIHLAADGNHIPLIEFLLENGADINLRDSEGQTPLHYASLCDHRDLAQILINRGADIRIRDNLGYTSAEIASSHVMKGILAA